MSQTGTPTEFLQLGITEPDDTLNVLVDLNGQWQKIDTGVKNVDTKANTNASGISALNTAVQDNTENITNILETNVNQQTSIDTLQAKVATLEEDDTSYGSRITAVEAGVQENSELINDLEVDLSGVKTSVGTVPSGSNLQGEVNGLDTRVTALENSGSVAAVEARVTTLETEVGTVPAGSTVQGQISDLDTDVTALQGQVTSGNIPFRFSVDGGGNYGYLKADDSFVPFRSGSNQLHELDTTIYMYSPFSYIVRYVGHSNSSSPNYKKVHDLINDVDYTLPVAVDKNDIIGGVIYDTNQTSYVVNNGVLNTINGKVAGIIYDPSDNTTHYLIKNNNNIQYKGINSTGATSGHDVNFTIHGTDSGTPAFFQYSHSTYYTYNYHYGSIVYNVNINYSTGQSTESSESSAITSLQATKCFKCGDSSISYVMYDLAPNSSYCFYRGANGNVLFDPVRDSEKFFIKQNNKYYYMV